MTPELARAAIEFLKRTELRGVETFVMHALLQELERDAKRGPAFDAGNYVNNYPPRAEPDAEQARAILEKMAVADAR